jgi:hypothetical protein
MNMMKEDGADRRDSFRLELHVPMSLRLLTPREAEEVLESSVTDVIEDANVKPLPKNPKPSDIPSYLAVLNQKLDLILRVLVTGEKAGLDLKPANITLSEGGIGFDSDVKYDFERIMEIRMILSEGTRSVLYHTYGKVTRVEVKGEFWLIGLEFVHMPEWIRNQVANLIVEKQRGM